MKNWRPSRTGIIFGLAIGRGGETKRIQQPLTVLPPCIYRHRVDLAKIARVSHTSCCKLLSPIEELAVGGGRA